MIRRLMAATALLALASCASADDSMQQAAPAQPAPYMNAAPAAPPSVAAPGIAAPGVVAPAPPRAPPPRGDLVVPGQVEREVAPPTGDPRSVSERMRDIRAWDDCVMRAQGAGEGDPMRPQLDSPEDICRNALGMNNRNAVPESRRP